MLWAVQISAHSACTASRPRMKPSLVRSTRLSGSVKLRCALGSGSFEGGRGTGPEALAVSRLAFLLRCAFGFGFRRRGSCGLRLKRLSGLADFGQALLFVGDPAGHSVAATACAGRKLSLARRLLAQLQASDPLRREAPSRVFTRLSDRLVFGGVRLDLRAVERDMPQLRQPGFFASFSTRKIASPAATDDAS